ncbi:MAG: hypothetical protein ABWY93_33570 [Mycobacterium sp.]
MREQFNALDVADWLMRAAQMLLMEHFTIPPDETRRDTMASAAVPHKTCLGW